jgi:hypothetical protein
VRVDILDHLAQALTALIREQSQRHEVEITVLDLIEAVRAID